MCLLASEIECECAQGHKEDELPRKYTVVINGLSTFEIPVCREATRN